MTTTTGRTAGWPFLVARGRRQDYRCVLVPEFLDRLGGRGFLADSVSGNDSGAPPTVAHLADAPGGPITLVYRAHRLTRADLADTSEPYVLDEHGRPLHLLYGLAYQNQSVRVFADVEPDLDVALAAALSAYRDFWRDEIGFRTRTSKPVPSFHSLAEGFSSVKPRFVVDDERSVPYLSQRCTRIVLVVALAVALAAAGVILGNAVDGPGPTPVDVRTPPGYATHAHNPGRPTRPRLSRAGQHQMTIRIS
jgi:hypothetical protein